MSGQLATSVTSLKVTSGKITFDATIIRHGSTVIRHGARATSDSRLRMVTSQMIVSSDWLDLSHITFVVHGSDTYAVIALEPAEPVSQALSTRALYEMYVRTARTNYEHATGATLEHFIDAMRTSTKVRTLKSYLMQELYFK